MWLFFDRHRRMSDFTGTDRREGGREEMEGIGRWKWRKGMSMSRAPRLTKGSMCNHYSSPSLSWAALKKNYLFFLITAKVGTVLTTQVLFWLWLCDKGNTVGSYLPKWWPDKGFFLCFVFFCQSERRGLGFGERQNERIALRGEARTNEWAKKDKMEWSSIKRLAVISSSPPSPLALMS